MLGIHARPQINKVTEPVARRLAGWGVTPDALTIVGTLGVAGGALGFYPRGKFFVGTLVITAFVFSDMLDGAVARVRGTTGRWAPSSTRRSTGSATVPSSARWRSGTPATATTPRCARWPS